MDAPTKAAEIKAAITGVIAFITALVGPVGWLVFVWLFAMLMDYVTGSWAALSRGEWDSSVARRGLWHKLGSIAAVLISAMLDIALGVIVPRFGIEYGYIIVTPIVCIWYLLTELGSMVENIDKLGAPVPEFLRQMIKKARGSVDKAGDKIADAVNDEAED